MEREILSGYIVSPYPFARSTKFDDCSLCHWGGEYHQERRWFYSNFEVRCMKSYYFIA